MRVGHRRARALVALGVSLAVAGAAPRGARGAIADDSPSAVTLPSGNLSTEATNIRKVLEAYIHAVEAKDVQMFRSIVSSFPQTFQLAKETAGWTIQDIGR